MPNMLKKISVHNSRVTAKALADATGVTLDSDDNNPAAAASANEDVQQLEAHPCDECEEECGGLIVDTVNNGGDVTSEMMMDNNRRSLIIATAMAEWDLAP